MTIGSSSETAGIGRSAACLAAGAIWLGLAGWASSADAGPRSLTDVVYDYAVTSYCGVLTPEVELGFRRELAALTADSGLTPEQAKAQRIAGWVAADNEWSNRGLGGFRAWCESEGLAAARRFLAIARDSP